MAKFFRTELFDYMISPILLFREIARLERILDIWLSTHVLFKFTQISIKIIFFQKYVNNNKPIVLYFIRKSFVTINSHFLK